MTIITVLDLIGTFAFAISGTLAAAEKRLDLFGAAFAASLTAIGGGTIRDLLIGIRPVSWIQDPTYFYIIIIAVVITFLFKKYVMGLRKTLFLFDTIGIGVFTIIGLQKALYYDIHPVLAVVMGVTTAVMGGVLRDTFVNDLPMILRKEIYATACLVGALIYILLTHLGVGEVITLVSTMSMIIIIRLIAVRYHLRLPIIVSNDKSN